MIVFRGFNGNLFPSLDKLFLKGPSLGINLNLHVELCQGLTIVGTKFDAFGVLYYNFIAFHGLNQKFISKI